MSPDESSNQKIDWSHITPWRAAVLGSFFVSIILSIALYIIIERVDTNANRGRTAICVEVGFLESSIITQEDLLSKGDYSPEELSARRDALDRTEDLVTELRSVIHNCPPRLDPKQEKPR